MTLLTVDELREHVATTLSDAALQRLLDDAEGQIVAFAGPNYPGPVTEYVGGGSALVTTSRPISAITSITETVWTTDTTLTSGDYFQSSAYVIERLPSGANSRYRWTGRVTIVYTPVDDTAQRKAVQIELVKLEIMFSPGLAAETVGSWTQQYVTSGSASLDNQRADAMSRLRAPGIGVV